jgi:hypothetical protein
LPKSIPRRADAVLKAKYSSPPYCHDFEWLSTGFWIGDWIQWPLTGRNYK